jgi:hypothetical protein
MSDRTTYSDLIDGDSGNHDQPVRFDKTAGYIGIAQWESGGKLTDRVLLSPAQMKALREFVKATR